MSANQPVKRRGFVMTGGGAKGFYEAGVIHAFHLTGMEFDIITGSSIGAMNSIFYAEYQYRKKQLPPEVQKDPEAAIQAMEPLVKAYQHAWFQMPAKRLIDDGESGPLGKLKNDLLKFNISFPALTRLGWWWTDPQRGDAPPPAVWPAAAKVLKELAERLGGMGEVLRIFKDHRRSPFREALRSYLARFELQKSLIPAGDDSKLKSFFTVPVAPLTSQVLAGEAASANLDPTVELRLVDPERTLRDYYEAQIDVRLTRANYRTGRLEVSTYYSDEDFVAFLEKQAWRLQSSDPEVIPLGSFRLHIPGNPNAVNAALASGRFPGVFYPYPLDQIYDLNRPENRLLNLLTNRWLADDETETRMVQAYQKLHPESSTSPESWQKFYASWRESAQMRDFFPQSGDFYLDGGAIDNTPSNSAVDATREWADRQGVSRRDLTLELFVIYLGSEPKVSSDEIQEPTSFQVVKRTLDIQGVAKQSSDAVVVDTINLFGKRGSDLGETLLLLVNSVRDVLPHLEPAARIAVLDGLRQAARQSGLRGFLGSSADGLLERIESWASSMVDQRMPLQVEMVKIYPEQMALSTLQFTDRLGYRLENGLQMITGGCFDTLWALREHLEGQSSVDEADQRALNLARKWMGSTEWPTDTQAAAQLKASWPCQRKECVFHAQYCLHGAQAEPK